MGLGILLLGVNPGHCEEVGTYWIDPKCDGKFETNTATTVQDIVEEAIDHAKVIRDRLIRTESEEPDAYIAFETLMKFKPLSTRALVKWQKFKSPLFKIDTIKKIC